MFVPFDISMLCTPEPFYAIVLDEFYLLILVSTCCDGLRFFCLELLHLNPRSTEWDSIFTREAVPTRGFARGSSVVIGLSNCSLSSKLAGSFFDTLFSVVLLWTARVKDGR